MKKLFYISLLAIMIDVTAKAQTGGGVNCLSSEFINTSILSINGQVIYHETKTYSGWYDFYANDTTTIIKLTNISHSPKIKKVVVYSGSCVGLTVIASDSINSLQTTLTLTLSTTSGTLYFFQAIKSNLSAAKAKYNLAVSGTISTSCSGIASSPCTAVLSSIPCEYVNNGNFEQNISPPLDLDMLSNACGWFNPSISITQHASPDYFFPNGNVGAGGWTTGTYNCAFSVNEPCNLLTYTYGHTIPSVGNGYAGLTVLETDTIPGTGGNPSTVNYYAEYMETKLRAPMVAGVTYSISMWVKKATYVKQATNNIGIMLSSAQITQTGYQPITGGGIILNYPNTVNTTSNWQQIQFVYTPVVSTLQYITIGDFKPSTTVFTSPGCYTPGFINYSTSCIPYSDECNCFKTNGNICDNPFSLRSLYYNFDDISITPVLQPLSVSGATPICANQLPEILTASGGFGGTSYNWNTGQTGTSISINSGGLYTVTNWLTGLPACSTSANINITVNQSPNVLVTSNPNTPLCLQNPLDFTTLTATSNVAGTTFNWIPPTGLSSTTGAVVTANPGTTTTYQVTGTAPNGCTGTANITVNVINCQCTNGRDFTNDWPSNQLNNASQLNASVTWSINNNITVGGNVTLFNKTLYFGPNISITILPGASLTLTQCYLTACTDMWKGIIVSPGASLTVQKGALRPTRIEDAIAGIDCNNWNQTGNTLTVNGAVFNRNLTSINISNFQWPGFNFPATIKDAVFTSRKNITALNAPSLKNLVFTQALQSPYYLRGLPLDVLKNPYPNQPPQYGIYINNVGYTTLNNNVPVNTPIAYNNLNIGTAGTTNKNLFDNLAYGIAELKSNVNIINSDFELLVNYPGYLIGNGITTGTGVFGAGTITSNSTVNLLQVIYPGYVYGVAPLNYPFATPVDNCNFYDCITGAECYSNAETHVAGTVMQSTQNLSSQNGSLPGAMGINAVETFYIFNDLSYNQITNLRIGINFNEGPNGACVFNPFPTPHFNCTDFEYIGTTHIDNNVIQNDLGNGSSSTTRFVKYAIIADNTLNCYSTPPPNTTFICNQEPNAVTTANNNFIYNAFNGIAMGNWQLRLVQSCQAQTNYIKLVNDPATIIFGIPVDQYGINHYNNINNIIYNNNIIGTGITRPFVHGIWAQMNATQLVQCNQTTNIERGVEFLGQNAPTAPTQWMDNTMQNNNFGLFMNLGIIGQQNGTALNPVCDNHWLGSWNGTTTFQTLNNSTTPGFLNSSKLICRAGSQFFPTVNGGTAGYQYNGFFNPFTVLTGSPGITRICAPLPTVPCFTCQVAANRNILERIATDSIPFSILANQSRFMGKLQLLRAIIRDTSVMASSSVLHNFFANSSSTPLDIINNIESNLVQGNTVAAQSLMSSFSSTDTVALSHKTLFNTMLNLSNGVYTAVDSLALYNLAIACPLVYGSAVYQAKTLYNGYYRTILPFNDACQSLGNMMRKAETKTSTVLQNNNSILVFPNPTAGDIYISGMDIQEKEWTIIILDVSGRIIIQGKYLAENGLVKIPTQLDNGAYFINVNVPNNKSITKHIIVNH